VKGRFWFVRGWFVMVGCSGGTGGILGRKLEYSGGKVGYSVLVKGTWRYRGGIGRVQRIQWGYHKGKQMNVAW